MGQADDGDGGVWRTVVFKESTNYYAYALYGSTGTNVPSGNGVIGGTDRDLRGTAGLAATPGRTSRSTYDGDGPRALRQRDAGLDAHHGGIPDLDNGVLKIGGNAIWGEWFNGLIDEVRIYNRALTAAQIGTT